MAKKALITGISGMVGSLLAEYLLEQDCEVYGILRRSSSNNTQRIQHLFPYITLISGDLTDQASLDGAVEEVRPDFIFHLGAMSFVPDSWIQPETTTNVTGLGTLRMLEAMGRYAPEARFLTSCSSEQFGKVVEIPQTEKTPFYPRSPYGVAKTMSYEITRVYRESFNQFACSSICFNMESTRRGEQFVTRKIAMGVAKIKAGLQDYIELGNLEAKRDWMHAKDAVKGMWLILQQPKPEDFVLASGETHSIREFLEEAFRIAGITYWSRYVKINEAFLRPAEVDLLLGDPSKAERELGWTREYNFEDIVADMVTFEMARLM